MGVDPATCVAQYIVSTYMIANAEQRAVALAVAVWFLFETARSRIEEIIAAEVSGHGVAYLGYESESVRGRDPRGNG